MNTKISEQRLIFKLRTYREAMGVSQKDTADRLNIGFRSYQRIESGESTCDVAFLYRYCKEFKLDFCSLTSPRAPLIRPNYHFILNESEIKNFEENQLVKESDLLNLFGKLKTCDSLEEFTKLEEFKKSRNAFAIFTPTKKIFNDKALVEVSYERSSSRLINGVSNFENIISYWDCVYYYMPKYSIVESANTIFDKTNRFANTYSVHCYNDGPENMEYLVLSLIALE